MIIFRYVMPSVLCAYLKSKGWVCEESNNDRLHLYTLSIGDKKVKVNIPRSMWYSDYQGRMQEVLEILGLVENRPHSEIARAISKYSFGEQTK